MARILLYERVVDAVLTCANSSLCDMEIQNGVKIKDEPVDTTLNTVTTDTLARNLSNLENDTLNKNYFNISHEASLLENDVRSKIVNSRKTERMSKSYSVYTDDTKKISLKRKRTTVKTEQVCDTLQSKKKQKHFHDLQISKNENINVFTKITEKFEKKKKHQGITLDFKTKKQCKTRSSKKKESRECNICFRKFSSSRNCETHKQFYIGDYQCKNCKKPFKTRKKLYLHTKKCYSATYVNYPRYTRCNFCNRAFKKKAFLQSHLFHLHSELNSTNIIKCKNPKSNAYAKSSCLNNLIKSKKRNITLINNEFRSDDDMMKIDILKTENSFSDGLSPTKKLRQPKLTEYIELSKRKRDIKASPNKFNTLFYNKKTAKNLKLSEIYNENDSLPTKSNNLEQIAHYTLKQDKNHKVSKMPFVKLHADVEIMKSFLEKLPIEDKTIEDQRNNIVSCYHEVPYNLRSLRTISSTETISNSKERKNKDIFKKSQLNIEYNTKMKHNETNSDKINSNFWKTIMDHFNCKDCKIILTRCDEKINCHKISAIKTMFKKNISLPLQCNSISFEENDIQNKIVLKKLEVSLKRLTFVPVADTTKMKTVSDIEKRNDDSFLCKVCKKSFSSKLDKHIHIKSFHIAYMSSICDARYKLKHKLLQHYLSEHLSKQNQCCVCYTLLSNYVELKRHLYIHCLKYVQRENDQYPIDIELKCSSIKNNYKCLNCDTAFLTQSNLMIHQSFCMLQKEITKDQKDFMKKINALPKILKMQHSNANGLAIISDEKTHSDKCLSKNSVEITNKHHILLINKENSKITEENSKITEENLKVSEEVKINQDKQNSSVNNNLITKEIKIINESQKSVKFLENDNSTISNQNNVNTQLNTIKTKISIYPCDICGKQFQNPKNLQQHIRAFNNTTDICPICGTAFGSKRLLQTHITAAHVPQISKTYNFHCMFCNQGFIKKYELRPHILHLHGQQILNTFTDNSRVSQTKSNTQIAICNVCNLVFDTYDRYMEHKMYYYKNHTFTCSLCAQTFQGMYMLHHHNKLTHYSEDKRRSYNYICDICNEGFNLESHFHSHNMHIHLNEENLTEIAKESEERSQFDPVFEMQEQIKNYSTNQQKEVEQSLNEYICQICQLKFTDFDDMTKHTAFYSNDGNFKCNKCKRQCKTLDLLYQHKTLTHICRDIGYACNVCGEVLKTIISLECHKKHFHLNDNIFNNADNCKNYEQTIINRLFLNTANQVKHQLKSNDALNVVKCRYNCLFCDMKFFSANAIQMHITQSHIDDLFTKDTTLKARFSIIKSDNIQKQSVQQLIEADQASTSAAILTSTSVSSTTTLSAIRTTAAIPILTSTSVLVATTPSVITTSVATIATSTLAAAITTSTSTLATAITTSISATATITSTPTTATITSTSETVITTSATAVAATFKNNSTQFFQNKIPNNILDKNGIKDKTNESSNQIKATFSNNNKIAQNISMSSINKFKINVATSKPVVLSNQFNINNPKIKTLVPLSIKSINDSQLMKNYTNSVKAGSNNELKTNFISNKFIDKFKVCVVQSTEPYKTIIVVPQAKTMKNNEIINKKSESMSSYNGNSNYMCPLCSLEYPSLMFFHAHLRYAHTDSIQTDMINPQLMINPQFNQLIQEVSLIRCLLCPCMFTDENKYKSHLKNSHNYVDISNSNMRKIDDKKKNTTPEIITVDDDDNVKNNLNQHTAEITTILAHGKQNEKIGKLRVKPFSKIIENLSNGNLI